MRNWIFAAMATAALATTPAMAQNNNSTGDTPNSQASANGMAVGSMDDHSKAKMAKNRAMKNGTSQSGTSDAGGGSMDGPHTTQGMANGSAAGGSTGGTKSTGP